MKAILLLVFGLFVSHSWVQARTVDSLPGKILIVNSFDSNDSKERNKKQKLMNDLAQLLQQELSLKIRSKYYVETLILDGIIKEKNKDSIIALMLSQQTTKAILITELDVYFDQTHVDVTGTKGDKTRIAYYDICVKASFDFYNRQGRLSELPVNHCEFYTHRNVISGLLAAGPDVVKRKKDAERMIFICADQYAQIIGHEMMAY